MKTRNGFVSNSSSASFVIVGVKISDKELEKIFNSKNDEDGLFDAIEESEFFREWDEGLFGIKIAEKHSDGDMESKEYTLDEFARMVQKVSDKTGKDVKEIKIFTGERSC